MTTPRWPRRRQALPLLLVGTLLLGACGATASAQSATTSQTTTLGRGTVEATINATGTVRAVGDLSLSLEGGGAIREVLVKVGDRVAAGQALLKADARDLQLELQQAEANVASAQAQYEQAADGATEKEVAQAEAAVRSAEAQYQQTLQGTTTPQDIASAQSALRSAEAGLAATIAGTTTPQDLANAEAALRSAEAQLAATRAGTTTPQDIVNAEAAVRSAEAKLAATIAGTTTPQDIATAEATLRSATAGLAELQAGPNPSDLAGAEQTLRQARENRAKQESQLSLSKGQANVAMEQAANQLRSAQATYGAAKLIWDEAQRTGKDPNIPEQKGAIKGYRDLTDAKRRQYKNDFETAERAMANAEQALAQSQLAYEDAKRQEIVGLQTADSQILAAQASLDKVKAGASAAEIAQAQASVDQARAALEKLQQPARASDVAQAEAAVDQARASLEKLQQPVKASDIAQAQAAVDQARASLEKLRQPAKASDVAQAQASVEQARASLEKLQQPADPEALTQVQASVDQAQATLTELAAGPKAADLATALAGVKQAEVARDLARSALDKATLVAPFAGVVAAVNAIPGQPAAASSASTSTSTSSGLITLVDDSTLSIDVSIAEADVARVAAGQPARATFAALTGQAVPGRVTAVSPKATVASNVVSYAATVALDGSASTAVKTGMTASVAIVTAQKADVLLLPNRAIQTQGGQKSVTVQYHGEQFAVPVQVGLVGDSSSEIVGGLAEGDVVVIGATQTGTQTGTQSTTQTRPGGIGLPGVGGAVTKPTTK